MVVLFAHPLGHPRGGAADAIGVFDDVEQAKQAAVEPVDGVRPIDYDVCEVAESRTGVLVVTWEWRPGGWANCAPLPRVWPSSRP